LLTVESTPCTTSLKYRAGSPTAVWLDDSRWRLLVPHSSQTIHTTFSDEHRPRRIAVLATLSDLEVSIPIEDCDDMDGALVDLLPTDDGTILPTGDHRLLGRRSTSLRELLSLSVGGRDGVLSRRSDLRLTWLIVSPLGSTLGRLSRPCLPMRINGTIKRDILENAVVAMKVCVYASSGWDQSAFPS
jgi:hypothetical protein